MSDFVMAKMGEHSLVPLPQSSTEAFDGGAQVRASDRINSSSILCSSEVKTKIIQLPQFIKPLSEEKILSYRSKMRKNFPLNQLDGLFNDRPYGRAHHYLAYPLFRDLSEPFYYRVRGPADREILNNLMGDEGKSLSPSLAHDESPYPGSILLRDVVPL